jgi:hypothetical protein
VHSDAAARRTQAKRETKTRAHRRSRREKIFHRGSSTAYAPIINSFSTGALNLAADEAESMTRRDRLTDPASHTTLEFR